MRAALKCYGWNVFKRIINNRFSSSTVLFLTNMQQLKALISSEDCSNGAAFRVRHSSHHIAVNRMLWPEPGNQPQLFFPPRCGFSLCSLVNVSLLHANITAASLYKHTHMRFFSHVQLRSPWEMLHLFP